MTTEFESSQRKEARLVLLEKLAGQAQEQYTQIATRQDSMDGKIDDIKDAVIRIETHIEDREERCASHASSIQRAADSSDAAHKRINVLTRQVADIPARTFWDTIKIISVYTGALTVGASVTIGIMKLIGA